MEVVTEFTKILAKFALVTGSTVAYMHFSAMLLGYFFGIPDLEATFFSFVALLGVVSLTLVYIQAKYNIWKRKFDKTHA